MVYCSPQPLGVSVVIVPAPVEHGLTISDRGLYVCRWIPEYSGPVRLEV